MSTLQNLQRSEGHLTPAPGVRDTMRKSVELTNPLSRGKGQEEERFLGKKTLIHSLQGLMRSPIQALEDESDVPSRETQLLRSDKLRKTLNQYRKWRRVCQIHALQSESRTESNTIALNGGCGQALVTK